MSPIYTLSTAAAAAAAAVLLLSGRAHARAACLLLRLLFKSMSPIYNLSSAAAAAALQCFYFLDVLTPEQRIAFVKGCYPYMPRIAPGECGCAFLLPVVSNCSTGF
jgi:hypothetical protein